MSFKFDWSRVSTNKDLREGLREKINSTLQKELSENENYSVILRKLDFGSEPPALQILTIPELKSSKGGGKVHLVFSFAYRGDASMSFDVNLQVNPLVSSKNRIGHLGRTHMGTLSAHLPLRASIFTALSHFQLEGTLDLMVDVNNSNDESDNNEEESEYEPEYITLEDEQSSSTSGAPSSSSIITKSKEVIQQKIRSLSSSGRKEETLTVINNHESEFSEVVKPKKPPKKEKKEGTNVTFTLMKVFQDVTVNTSFDGARASIVIGNTIKKHIANGLNKIIGKPQTLTFNLPSTSSSSLMNMTPGSSVTPDLPTAEGQP